MAWFKYLKSTESINSSTTNSNYSYPYCKRFIGRFTPRDTLEANTWIFASILDININTYKDTSLENQTDETSYIVTYEKGDNVYPVETVIEGDYIYFKTYEIHTAAEEIVGQYAAYYNTPNLRKLNEVDNAGTDDYQVNPAPVWESIELDSFVYGESYDDLISAVGTIYSVSSGALPTGLSINSSTGRITGTVTSTGAYSFTIRATTDDGKYYNEASFSGVINEIPSWIDNTLANINYNSSYSDSVWADGVPSPAYSISSGALPDGITLNATTGALTGTSTDSGAYSFTIKAENLSGSITQSFTGTVQTPPYWSDQTLGIITQGVAYSDGVSANGTATITYSIYSGSLPTGLSLNSSTGAITGSTGSTGSYSFTIRGTNSWGYIEKAFSGIIYQIPAWTDSTIANMIYGQAYSNAVAASGYPTVTYSISAGALPSGITLNSSTGAIAGTSTVAGSYSFTVKAENAAGNVTQLFTDDLYVTPAWTDNTLAAFIYNAAYSDGVVATGSPTYTISSGTLPTGLSLNSSTGAVTGTPTYYGAYSFTVQAANETGSVTQSFSGAINRTPSWTDNTLATPIYNTAYSDSVVAIGYPTPTYSVTTGTLPTGLSLNSSSGAVTGTTTATGSHSFTITASNTEGSISQAFSFDINLAPTWNDETLGTPTYNTAYSDGVSSNAAYPAVTYSISAGSLPSGFSIDSSTGAIIGTYTTPVNDSSFSYTFTVKAENTAGNVTKEFTWSISIPFTVSGGSSYNAGTGYSARSFTANGTFQILTGKKNIEVLIIPGGGGGGGGASSNDWYGTGVTYAPGGGGASSETFTPTLTDKTVGSYPVVVGAGGAGGARAYVQTPSGNAAPSTATASDGSSGGNSNFQDSGTTYTASGAQGGGKGTATSGGNNPSGVYYNYAASGGLGAGNSLYAYTPGVLIDNQITAGSGGSGLGSRGSAPALYYTGGPGGSSVTIWNLTIGYGGDGGSYASRAGARVSAGSGGSGGSGVNSSSSGPGNAGYRGQVIIRWAT